MKIFRPLKIKVKVLTHDCEPKIIDKGEWIDLYSSENFSLRQGDFTMIPLGVAMKIPKGFEAHIAPRSSSFKNYGIIQTNSVGVVDSSYSGNNDEWKLPAYSLKDGVIQKFDRVCQFRIQLSQKATVWQKLKWFLSSGVEIVFVDNLDDVDRGGFGSTGKQ